MSGKGDIRRPHIVTEAELDERWERTFGARQEARQRPRTSREAAARRIGQIELPWGAGGSTRPAE